MAEKKKKWGWIIIAVIILYPQVYTNEQFSDFDLPIYLGSTLIACYFYYWIKDKVKFIKNDIIKSITLGLSTVVIFSFFSAAVSAGIAVLVN